MTLTNILNRSQSPGRIPLTWNVQCGRNDKLECLRLGVGLECDCAWERGNHLGYSWQKYFQPGIGSYLKSMFRRKSAYPFQQVSLVIFNKSHPQLPPLSCPGSKRWPREVSLRSTHKTQQRGNTAVRRCKWRTRDLPDTPSWRLPTTLLLASSFGQGKGPT